MVTQVQLAERLIFRTFRPFRVVLKNGEFVDVVRTLQAVTQPGRLVVAVPEGHFRFIRLDEIDRVEDLQAEAV